MVDIKYSENHAINVHFHPEFAGKFIEYREHCTAHMLKNFVF